MKKNVGKMMKVLLIFIVMMAPIGMMRGQETNAKFSLTTQIFLNEMQQHKLPKVKGKLRAQVMSVTDSIAINSKYGLIASPDTVGNVVYISCFIHLKDINELSEVQSLGVEVQESFDGLDFITARVPVDRLEDLSNIDNVTNINVAQRMRPMTDKAREMTNVDDLLTQSAFGINSMYDGTGVALGVMDTGIDFNHIAFKDRNGNSRIKWSYIYDGKNGTEYHGVPTADPATDDVRQDHGTHCASTAGGSSVMVDGSTVTVTDDHANATYGGMAPGADLYLAGVKGLNNVNLVNALKKMVEYADAQNKPLVVSNSWGSSYGPRNGTGEWAQVVGQYFGDAHPNHIIVFASSNAAGHGTGKSGGGLFVKKDFVSCDNPLGTIIRTGKYGGNIYEDQVAVAWASAALNCKLYVLNNSTGEVLNSWTVTKNTTEFSGLDEFYSGSLTIYIENDKKYKKNLVYVTADGLLTKNKSAYTLAFEVYPTSGTDHVDMWAGDWSNFTGHLTTAGHTWIAGTDDMSVSDEATIHDAISVGAYVSKNVYRDFNGEEHSHESEYTVGDIAYFSSYATAELSPTGVAYPWITAPGARLAAGVSHYHTTSVDDYSYFGSEYGSDLVVNNSENPYAMMEGTSMATPTVAGIIALWLQAAKENNKSLTVNQVKDVMARTAINDYYTTTGTNASHFGQGKIDALAGIRYIVDGTIELADDSYNSNNTLISRNDGSTVNVLLGGRTLYKDGDWNSLCLPFNVDLEADGCPLAGAEARLLTEASVSNSTLNLSFSDPVSTLDAGRPYIIKWGSGDNLTNLVFNNVTIDATDRSYDTNLHAEAQNEDGIDYPAVQTDERIRFLGTYGTTNFTDDDNSVLFLGAENALYYPLSGASIKSQRAYFKIGTDDSNARTLSSFKLSFADETTAIASVSKDSGNRDASVWYDLSGRRLNVKPANGVYINRGRKLYVK